MKDQRSRILMVAGVSLAFLCTGLRCCPDVDREDPSEVIDYSGKWNDTDAQMVAEEMIKDALQRAWIDNWERSHDGARPVMVVGRIRNKSHEHIDTEVFTKSFEMELINSGRVRVVAEKDMRPDIREERKDIQINADPATIKKFGKEIGADFILLGVISTIKDEVKQRYVMYYQTNLEMIDIETNEKVWIGEKKIKKDIKRRAFKLF